MINVTVKVEYDFDINVLVDTFITILIQTDSDISMIVQTISFLRLPGNELMKCAWPDSCSTRNA